jgi:GT2 family glycosyltransferase
VAPAALADQRALRRAAWLCETVLLAEREEGDAVELPPEAGEREFTAPGARILALPGGHPLRARAEERLCDLGTFLREGPAGWDSATRTRLLDFLASLGADHGLSASMGEGLRQAREALRERWPIAIEDRRIRCGLTVDRLHRIDEHSFYVRGRAWDEVAAITTLAAISPEGERVELQDLLSPHPAGEGGFAARFTTKSPSRGDEGWVLEARSGPERGLEVSAALTPDPSYTLFADADLEFDGAEALRERHVHPAVTRLSELRRDQTDIIELSSHGPAPASPAISLVVALQRRVDLVEHQIAQLAADPEIRECELLFVLGDPEEADVLQELGPGLFALYGLPFRLAVVSQTGGQATACQLGASLARAERILFLGSDVLPDRPGWLGAMATALDSHPGAAAATPKLLFSDEAIDQAGLEYLPASPAGQCLLRPRLRGMHREVALAGEDGAVAAAGLACLMIEAEELAAAGGLEGRYELAEFEGADLARRLAGRGQEVRYVPEAELYRLEGLGAEPERLGEGYAQWLHSRLWARTITEEAR